MRRLSVRIPNDAYGVLQKIAEAYGVNVSDLVRCILKVGLEILQNDTERLNPYIRLEILNVLIDEDRKKEKLYYEAYKSALRSNEYLTTDDETEVLNDGTIKKKTRRERIHQIAGKDQRIIDLLNCRRFYAEKLKERGKKIGEILKQLGEYRELDELDHN
jgi:predicted DNA-binding ribbon-helix-helix protein